MHIFVAPVARRRFETEILVADANGYIGGYGGVAQSDYFLRHHPRFQFPVALAALYVGARREARGYI